MKRGQAGFTLVFSLAGACLVIFILLPVVATILATSPKWLAQTLIDPQVLRSIGLTFGAAGIATAIALLGGVPLAFLLARHRFKGKRLVESIIDLPVVIPHTAAGVALLMVFGSRGMLGRWFAQIGVIFTDSLAGIVVAMLFVSLSYLVNLSREAFGRVDPELEATALVEGASPWQSFLQVSLPIAWRGVVAGAMMMWARGISEFGAVVILAYYPKIVPTLIFERFEGFGLNAALPVAAILIIVVLILFSVLRWLILPEEDS